MSLAFPARVCVFRCAISLNIKILLNDSFV
jgi:hypothetical protein